MQLSYVIGITKKKKKKENMTFILFVFLATCWITTTLQLIQFLDRGDT